jgi:hypothetical protein
MGLLHAKREEFLTVLEYPHLPLHNNLAQNDIREYARLRKISAGTRSDLGRRCRDTFLSLKKTCRMLGVRFSEYLRNRLAGTRVIPRLTVRVTRRVGRHASPVLLKYAMPATPQMMTTKVPTLEFSVVRSNTTRRLRPRRPADAW